MRRLCRGGWEPNFTGLNRRTGCNAHLASSFLWWVKASYGGLYGFSTCPFPRLIVFTQRISTIVYADALRPDEPRPPVRPPRAAQGVAFAFSACVPIPEDGVGLHVVPRPGTYSATWRSAARLCVTNYCVHAHPKGGASANWCPRVHRAHFRESHWQHFDEAPTNYLPLVRIRATDPMAGSACIMTTDTRATLIPERLDTYLPGEGGGVLQNHYANVLK